MDTFSIRDLREHTGRLVSGAEAGHLALVTKHSKPVFIAVPFDDILLNHGLHIALAIHAFKDGTVSLGKAAKIADMPIEMLMEKLAEFNIDVVDYAAEDLEQETNIINKSRL